MTMNLTNFSTSTSASVRKFMEGIPRKEAATIIDSSEFPRRTRVQQIFMIMIAPLELPLDSKYAL